MRLFCLPYTGGSASADGAWARSLAPTLTVRPVELSSGRVANLHQLPDGELLAMVAALNIAPREALEHEELMRLMLPILRADLHIAQTCSYEPNRPLDVPVTLQAGLSRAARDDGSRPLATSADGRGG